MSELLPWPSVIGIVIIFTQLTIKLKSGWTFLKKSTQWHRMPNPLNLLTKKKDPCVTGFPYCFIRECNLSGLSWNFSRSICFAIRRGLKRVWTSGGVCSSWQGIKIQLLTITDFWPFRTEPDTAVSDAAHSPIAAHPADGSRSPPGRSAWPWSSAHGDLAPNRCERLSCVPSSTWSPSTSLHDLTASFKQKKQQKYMSCSHGYQYNSRKNTKFTQYIIT